MLRSASLFARDSSLHLVGARLMWPFRTDELFFSPTYRQAYISARPFPHLVLDGIFHDSALTEVAALFAKSEGWQEYEDRKRANSQVQDHPFFAALNSQATLVLLESLTGMSGLVIDPTMRGGGLHAIPTGGKLGIHVDFNRHRDLPLKRRLNTILYLNREWRDEWQGHLTLTNRGGEERARIAPVWNRWVIFEYGPEAWHGHPEPLACPEHVERRSAAIYYYEPLTAPLAFTGTNYAP